MAVRHGHAIVAYWLYSLQIVLLEDDFGAIVNGICEGRLIFENLKKCIAYVLSSNIPEIVPFLLFISAGYPLAIETIMILLIDLGTDLAPAVSVAYEEPEDAIMKMPPRTSDDHLVGVRMLIVAYGTIGVFETVACYVAFFWTFAQYGFSYTFLCHPSAWSNTRVDYNIMVKDGSKDEARMYFEDQCMVNDFWMNVQGTSIWGTKQSDVPAQFVDVPPVRLVDVPVPGAGCCDALRVNKAYVDYLRNVMNVTASNLPDATTLPDPHCCDLQTYDVTKKRIGNKFNRTVCENAMIGTNKTACPLIFELNHAANLWVPKNQTRLLTVESARCGQSFYLFRIFILSRAQSAFMVTVVWGQIANILIRKTQVNTIFGSFPLVVHRPAEDGGNYEVQAWRITNNHAMLYSILAELVTIGVLIWVPKFNNVFLLEQIQWSEGIVLIVCLASSALIRPCRSYAFALLAALIGLWILPAIILWDEVRKWFIRLNGRDGLVARLTYF
jgi:hypothetical protein